MLTSAARETLLGVETVIVDEVHAVAAPSAVRISRSRWNDWMPCCRNRRSASGSRRPCVRCEEVARFLGGRAPVHDRRPAADQDVRPARGRAGRRHDASRACGGASPGRRRLCGRNPRMPRARSGRTSRSGSSTSSSSTVHDRVRELPPARRATDGADSTSSYSERSAWSAPSVPRAWSTLWAEAAATAACPRQMMAQAGATTGAAPLLARAHHGSVSQGPAGNDRGRPQDRQAALRRRDLDRSSSASTWARSTSSCRSSRRRRSRAGCSASGEPGTRSARSRGACCSRSTGPTSSMRRSRAERMRRGQDRGAIGPANPLDILAQQTVAAVALEPLDVEEWCDTVRRSAPFATPAAQRVRRDARPAERALPERRVRRAASAYRLGSRRRHDHRSARRPAARGDLAAARSPIAACSASSWSARAGGSGRRVGELDEEMVYESRVGDVFALGTTSWRIEDITHDRVLVSPAFGQPGKVPFWKGDGLGRPAELGEAVGAFTRARSGGAQAAALDEVRARLVASDWMSGPSPTSSRSSPTRRSSTGHVPTDKTLVVERFRDELGDWRHRAALPVRDAGARAVGARGQRSACATGMGVDGLDRRERRRHHRAHPRYRRRAARSRAVRLRGGRARADRHRGGRRLRPVRRAVPRVRGTRAAHAALQPRQALAALAAAPAGIPVAGCRAQVPELPDPARDRARGAAGRLRPARADEAHRTISRAAASGWSRAVTEFPSPFARSLLFGYVAAFMYEGDTPLAERRAAALSLDSTLLAELLGRAELRELLDPDVIAQTEAELQRLAPERKARRRRGRRRPAARCSGRCRLEEIAPGPAGSDLATRSRASSLAATTSARATA